LGSWQPEDCGWRRPVWAKISWTPISIEKKLGVVVCASHPSHGRKHKIGGSWSRQAWVKHETLSQNNQSKKE
jgi:hypothetical protein